MDPSRLTINLKETSLSYETVLGLLTVHYLQKEKPGLLIKALEDEIILIKKHMGVSNEPDR